jgi:hypothetical protein
MASLVRAGSPAVAVVDVKFRAEHEHRAEILVATGSAGVGDQVDRRSWWRALWMRQFFPAS